MTVQGVDISRYQANYQPRAEDHFVIVKATEGRTVVNAYHDAQIARCRVAGKIVGHYHWLHAGNVPAQLDWFAAKAGVKPGDIIACDWENANPAVPKADMEAWVRAAERRFPRNRVVVYTFPFYGPFQAARGALYLGAGLWIADYRSNAPRDIFDLPWRIHQYTADPFDHNRARFASPAAMRAWANLEEGKPPVPTERLTPPYAAAAGRICSCLRDALPLVEYRFKERGWIQEDFSGLVTQWGYKNNAVDASSTTHNGGGVFDVRYSLVDSDEKLKVWQECGFAPFRRRPPQWSLSIHGHICVVGCDHIDSLAGRQVADFRNGENGLGGVDNHTPYDGPIYLRRTWQRAQEIYADLIEEMDMPTVAEVWDKDLTLGPGVHSAGWYIREILKQAKAANARTIVLAGATEKILAKLAADDPGEAQLQADLAAVRAELEALAAEDDEEPEPESVVDDIEESGPDDPYAPPHEADPEPTERT